MNKTLALLAAMALGVNAPATAAPEKYVIDPSHTNVVWKAGHFGFSTQSGKFAMVEGVLTLDEANPAASFVEVSIKPSLLATGDAKFDEHLKSKDFFDVQQYPAITFKSSKVEPTGKDTAKVTGDLMLHGVTRPVTLDVRLNKIGNHFMTQKKTVGFNATGSVQRSYWGMQYAIPGVDDVIPIEITAEASLADAPK